MAKNGMNPKKKSVLNHLADGATIPAAAVAAGVGVRTVYNWLESDEVFTDALDRVQSVIIDSILAYFMASQEAAQQTINELMTDESTPASVRLRAAELVIDRNIQLYELRSLSRRIQRLELQDLKENYRS